LDAAQRRRSDLHPTRAGLISADAIVSCRSGDPARAVATLVSYLPIAQTTTTAQVTNMLHVLHAFALTQSGATEAEVHAALASADLKTFRSLGNTWPEMAAFIG